MAKEDKDKDKDKEEVTLKSKNVRGDGTIEEKYSDGSIIVTIPKPKKK